MLAKQKDITDHQELETIRRRRRELHQIPEQALDLPKTAAYLKNELKTPVQKLSSSIRLAAAFWLILMPENRKPSHFGLIWMLFRYSKKPEWNLRVFMKEKCMPVVMMDI